MAGRIPRSVAVCLHGLPGTKETTWSLKKYVTDWLNADVFLISAVPITRLGEFGFSLGSPDGTNADESDDHG